MGIKERKTKERAARKQDILSAAEKIFIQKGYQRTTLEEIALLCELSKGTLYLYFKNKEQLFLAVIEKVFIGFNTAFIEYLSTTNDLRPDERLAGLATAALAYIAENPDTKSLLQESHIFMAIHGFDHESIQRMHKKSTLIPELLSSVVKQGIDDGVFHDVDPLLISEAYFSMIRGMMFPEVLGFSPPRYNAIYLQVVRCFIDGLYNNPNLELFM
jgi:AcrR family transcriptional regulator